MAELLVLARPDLPTDGGTYLSWSWAQGHVVSVQDDSYAWKAQEDPRNFSSWTDRKFALLRLPGISVSRVQRYLSPQTEIDAFTGRMVTVRSRLWQIAWATLPSAAKTILKNTGVLTIGPGGDFTWGQVQNFFLRLDTNSPDTDPLS